jgi:hypothetical protein
MKKIETIAVYRIHITLHKASNFFFDINDPVD